MLWVPGRSACSSSWWVTPHQCTQGPESPNLPLCCSRSQCRWGWDSDPRRPIGQCGSWPRRKSHWGTSWTSLPTHHWYNHHRQIWSLWLDNHYTWKMNPMFLFTFRNVFLLKLNSLRLALFSMCCLPLGTPVAELDLLLSICCSSSGSSSSSVSAPRSTRGSPSSTAEPKWMGWRKEKMKRYK